MNGSLKENEALIRALKSNLSNNSNEIVVFPSAVYLSQVNFLLTDSTLLSGAQNMSQHDKGAYTGEISPLMLHDLGVNYVLIGHSERRQYFGETSELTAEKIAAALKHNLIPVLCIGETLDERQANQTNDVLLSQLNPVIQKIGIENLSSCVIAYEPVWAIGTGLTATKEQVQETHAFIRTHIREQHADVSDKTRIIYGGSVKGSNAAEIFACPDVDGGLIGGASLNAEDFTTICNAIK
jgi:triosephosphate isomerase